MDTRMQAEASSSTSWLGKRILVPTQAQTMSIRGRVLQTAAWRKHAVLVAIKVSYRYPWNNHRTCVVDLSS